MSTISSTSTSSDTNSSDFAIFTDNSNEITYNETHTLLECTLTESEKNIITLSHKRLNKLITKLNVAKIHITPLVDIILQAATSCSEVEFKEKIRVNEPICSIPNSQYVRAFTAAQILRDVNTELLQHQKPKPAIYSMNTKNSFIVHQTIEDLLNISSLDTADTIYIDRDTMKQLLELHELVTQTINKLQKAEHIKKESFHISCLDKFQHNQKKSPEKIADETESGIIQQEPGCCPQFLGPITRKLTCICGNQKNPKDPEQDIEPAENMYQGPIHNDDSTATYEKVCSSGKQGCCQQFSEANQSNYQKGENQKDFDINHLKPQQPETKPTKGESVLSEDSEPKNLEQGKTEEESVVAPKIPLMLPNERQYSITPSDTVLRNFADTSSEKLNKFSADRISKSKIKDKSAVSLPLETGDSTDTNMKINKSTDILEEKNEREVKSPIKKETKKIQKSKKSPNKQQSEVTMQNLDEQTVEPKSEQIVNKKLKEKKLNSKQELKNKNSKKKLQGAERSIITDSNESGGSPTDDATLDKNNEIGDMEKKDEILTQDSDKNVTQKKMTPKETLKNRRKLKKIDSKQQSKVSVAADENVLKPTESDNKTKRLKEGNKKDSNKKDGNIKQKKEIGTDKPRKELKEVLQGADIITDSNEPGGSATDGATLNQNNETGDMEKKDEILKQNSEKNVTQRKMTPRENLKNRRKLKKTDSKQHSKVSVAADENVLKPTESDNKTKRLKEGNKKDSNKKDGNIKQKEEIGTDKSSKAKSKVGNKKDSRKSLENSKANEAVITVGDYPSQPTATVMQAPSIHVQNNDLATNKQFFQTNSNYSNKASNVRINQAILSNKASSDGTNDVNKQKMTPGVEKKYGYSANMPSPKKLHIIGDTDYNTAENNIINDGTKIEPQPEILLSRNRRDDEHKYNAQVENQTSQNQTQNKDIILEDYASQQNTKIDNVASNQTIVQRTKTISKDIISAIRRGMTPTTNEYQSNVKYFPANFKDRYDNVADAKVALLQCLSELTKIRSYINVCTDPELRTLQQSVNIQVMQHDKNCGMDDAPHVHCNLQGIELTMKADKDMYFANYPPSNLVTKKDAMTSTERLLIQHPINSQNSIVLVAKISSHRDRKAKTSTDPDLDLSLNVTEMEDPKFQSIPADATRLSEPPHRTGELPMYEMFDPQYTFSFNESLNEIRERQKLDSQDSSVGIPYVVGIKSLPKMDGNANTSESMLISVDSMKKIMDTVEIYHKNESVNRAINSININHLLLSCTPVSCSIKTCLNDRRDFPELPLKPSLTSLPLSVTDLVVIRQNIERKSKSNNSMNDNILPLRKSIYNRNTFEYYTNFQANFASNREYFVPRVYMVYYFEIQRNEEGGDSDRSGKPLPKKRTHLTTTKTATTHQDNEADSEAESKWSDFKIFDYLRKEFLSLRGDGLSPKTSNAINIKTSRGNRNKKIQVSMTKTIEIPTKQKPKRLRKYKELGTTNRATQSCSDTFATQTISFCKGQEKKNKPPIPQKHRTLHTQTTTQTSPTNSLSNILLDTIYETDLENCIHKPVQQIYNVPEIMNTPSSLLADLRRYSKAVAIKSELIVETNQYEINDTLKSNSSKMSRPAMSSVSDITKNDNKHIYPSFIPRRKTSSTNDGCKDKSTDESNIRRTNISTTRINKKCGNKYTRKEKKQSTSNSSSECDDVHLVRLHQIEPTSSSNQSQSKLISCSPKRQSSKIKRNIVRDKIKNLPVYNSESLGATLRQQQSFASNPSQVMFGCRSDNNTSRVSSVFNLPKKHSCGFLSVLSPTCGCPDVTVFIPCFCSDKCCENNKNSNNTDSLDILTKGVSGMYHVIMPPGSNRKLNN